MMKKLLLLAVLAPLAMQPTVKAAAAQGFLTRAVQVASDAGTKIGNVAFYNKYTDIATLGATFITVAHNTLDNSPLKKLARLDNFLSFKNKDYRSLPYILAVHEFLKTIINFRSKNKNTVALFLNSLKLISLIGLKVIPDVTENTAKACGLYHSW